ncbi:MAG: hypothetical protein LBU50_04005 [Cellulomonas sp.]|jgi:hypothetical protein|nr:hypothetical protein [Cellulomonas sp.]
MTASPATTARALRDLADQIEQAGIPVRMSIDIHTDPKDQAVALAAALQTSDVPAVMSVCTTPDGEGFEVWRLYSRVLDVTVYGPYLDALRAVA